MSNTAQDGRLVQQFGTPLGPAPVRLAIAAGQDPIETWEVLPREQTVRLSGYAVPGSVEIPEAAFYDAQGPGCMHWSNLRVGGVWVERPAKGTETVRLRAVFRTMERSLRQDDCPSSPFTKGGLSYRSGDGPTVPARLVSSSPQYAGGTM